MDFMRASRTQHLIEALALFVGCFGHFNMFHHLKVGAYASVRNDTEQHTECISQHSGCFSGKRHTSRELGGVLSNRPGTGIKDIYKLNLIYTNKRNANVNGDG